MSNIFKALKERSLQLRKESIKHGAAKLYSGATTATTVKQTSDSFITLIGEIEARAKKDQRDVTDEDCIKTLTKFVDNCTMILELAGVDKLKKDQAFVEQAIFAGYLPRQATTAELRSFVETIPYDAQDATAKRRYVGEAMKAVKAHFGLYDAKVAKFIVDETLLKYTSA